MATVSSAGAFGASINMSTASVGAAPTGRMELSFGSFGTYIATASASTGLLPGGWYAQGAYSRGYTKGYIRNAKADVQSALAVVGKMWENNSFRLTWLMGEQHTGITWLGISREQMEKEPEKLSERQLRVLATLAVSYREQIADADAVRTRNGERIT